MDGVILVRHDGGRKKYAFAVPEALAAHCHRGDELLVETRYGLRIARAVTEVLRGAKAEEQAKKVGGREVLRPVVGVIAPVVRQHVREGLYAELADGLRTRHSQNARRSGRRTGCRVRRWRRCWRCTGR